MEAIEGYEREYLGLPENMAIEAQIIGEWFDSATVRTKSFQG